MLFRSGLASFWQTPRILQSAEGQAAVGMGADEAFVALLHLGPAVEQPTAKPRQAAARYVEFLD